MEENQNIEETTTVIKETSHPMCANHPFMKSIIIGLLIFLGAFCAFYTVADWHLKRMMRPVFGPDPAMAEKMIKKQMHDIDKMFAPERGFARKTANIIHMEQTGKEYRVLIDLRAFDNNENNVQVSANGNILTINGRTIRKSKNDEQISEFQQNYMFGDNVKLGDLTKETNGY